MSESGDYTPASHWSGYDFATARRAYASHVVDAGPSRVASATAASVDAASLVPESLETECEAPLVLAIDVTGSMGDWPATIFSKLPYLEHEAQEYLGKDLEISFSAIGDYFSDSYPLQVQPFVKGKELKNSLEKLMIEGGGGGSSQESYDLAALYYGRNVKCPNAIKKPVLIFIGDEGIYSIIDETAATDLCHVDISDKKKLTPTRVFEELQEKFNVYIVRKPYNCDSNSPSSDEVRIRTQWVDLLGADHVISLPDPNRVVDVIFGILAEEAGRFSDFEKELKERQGKDVDGDAKISVVMKSLVTIHSKKKLGGPSSKAKSKAKKEGKSITRKTTSSSKSVGSKKSISLLDD